MNYPVEVDSGAIIYKPSYINTGSDIQKLMEGRAHNIQGVPEGKDNILRGRSIGHSKQNYIYTYVHVSYSERFPR
jgi:hypothetical protein